MSEPTSDLIQKPLLYEGIDTHVYKRRKSFRSGRLLGRLLVFVLGVLPPLLSDEVEDARDQGSSDRVEDR